MGDIQVSVDRDFARFGSKTYAINKINSVEVRARKPHGQRAVYLWGLLSLICVLSFMGSMSDPKSDTSAGILFFAALFGFLAWRAWLRSQIIEYQLFLMTSSSEAQAISSRDVDMIASLRDRIERAMAGQLS